MRLSCNVDEQVATAPQGASTGYGDPNTPATGSAKSTGFSVRRQERRIRDPGPGGVSSTVGRINPSADPSGQSASPSASRSARSLVRPVASLLATRVMAVGSRESASLPGSIAAPTGPSAPTFSPTARQPSRFVLRRSCYQPGCRFENRPAVGRGRDGRHVLDCGRSCPVIYGLWPPQGWISYASTAPADPARARSAPSSLPAGPGRTPVRPERRPPSGP